MTSFSSWCGISCQLCIIPVCWHFPFSCRILSAGNNCVRRIQRFLCQFEQTKDLVVCSQQSCFLGFVSWLPSFKQMRCWDTTPKEISFKAILSHFNFEHHRMLFHALRKLKYYRQSKTLKKECKIILISSVWFQTVDMYWTRKLFYYRSKLFPFGFSNFSKYQLKN